MECVESARIYLYLWFKSLTMQKYGMKVFITAKESLLLLCYENLTSMLALY